MQKVTKMIGQLGRERKIIKRIADADKFLNSQHNNDWSFYDGALKPGKYARAGGQWLNVKYIDHSLLAHI